MSLELKYKVAKQNREAAQRFVEVVEDAMIAGRYVRFILDTELPTLAVEIDGIRVAAPAKMAELVTESFRDNAKTYMRNAMQTTMVCESLHRWALEDKS
jgi:hypothetical protein